MGGAQTVLLSLIRATLRRGETVGLISPRGPVWDEIQRRFGEQVRLTACEQPVTSVGRKSVADIFRLAAYTLRFLKHWKLLRQARLLYSNGSRQLPTIAALSILVKRKTVYHVHTDYGALEKVAIRIAAKLPMTSAIVANSRFVAERLNTPSVIIENALDQGFAERPFQDRFGEYSSPFRAAVIGKLIPEKGQDIAVDAVKGLPISLHLIGDSQDASPQFRARLTDAYHEGVTTNLPDTLERLGIQFNIVPSTVNEAFGLSAIEGMACSCITIVSGNGGLTDIAERTGAVIAPTRDALASALGRLLEATPAQRTAIARAQYEATQKAYAPGRFATDIAILLARLLES